MFLDVCLFIQNSRALSSKLEVNVCTYVSSFKSIRQFSKCEDCHYFNAISPRFKVNDFKAALTETFGEGAFFWNCVTNGVSIVFIIFKSLKCV